jgi:hypothetical protein
MSQGFRRQGRRKRMRPRVVTSEKMETIPRSLLARTGGGLAEPNGHSASGEAAMQVPGP